MNFKTKLATGLEILAATGMRRSTYAPPFYSLLWKVGVPIPPLHFLSFRSIFLVQGTVFGVFWGLIMWWFSWVKAGLPAIAEVGASALAGLFFGLTMAAYTRHIARKHKLPNWSEIPDDVAKRFD